ncbi:MAG TPA: GNAT family N-acetyltransferase [Polyangiaceae bacterium]|nr:GNAT family N-acetyltransferase [Polyangiaceae bacterium]
MPAGPVCIDAVPPTGGNAHETGAHQAPVVSPIHVRAARVADLASIDRIYDHYVLHSTCTAQLEPAGMPARTAWFADHDARHPIVVAEQPPGVVVGWGSLSVYNRRAGYAGTVEDSVYIADLARGRGVGSTILAHLVDRARELGHRTVVAGVSGDQAPSLALHAKLGFVEVGRMRDVVSKFGRWLDVVYLQRDLATPG